MFLISISDRKIFWATVMIKASRSSSSSVADERPAEPMANSVERFLASLPIKRLITIKIRTIIPNVVKSCAIYSNTVFLSSIILTPAFF